MPQITARKGSLQRAQPLHRFYQGRFYPAGSTSVIRLLPVPVLVQKAGHISLVPESSRWARRVAKAAYKFLRTLTQGIKCFSGAGVACARWPTTHVDTMHAAVMGEAKQFPQFYGAAFTDVRCWRVLRGICTALRTSGDRFVAVPRGARQQLACCRALAECPRR